MNFKESIDWLYSFKQYGSRLGLQRISDLVKKLENPQNNYKTIHVTGTNGKGSVCKIISSILNRAGYKVGTYISPHLQRFSERIVINDNEISEEDIVRLINKIKPIVEEMINKNNSPTFFEITTAIAFLYFSDENVDFAVIEVGLGGRFDATNVIKPMVSVITNISLEHTKNLGEDVESIAFEKAGIIKEKIPVVSAAKKSAKEVIKKVAVKMQSKYRFIKDSDWKRLNHTETSQEFIIYGDLTRYTVKTSLLGKYQGENIAVSILAIEHIQMAGHYIAENDIIQGVLETFNPGRMEIISEKPTIILDGAHNPTGAEMLKLTFEGDFEYDKLIIVLGILEDKDINNMLSSIVPISDIIIITKSSNTRACDTSVLKDKIEKIGFRKKIVIEDYIPKAIEQAKELANKKDIICITGSLFTVGEARNYFQIYETNIIKS